MNISAFLIGIALVIAGVTSFYILFSEDNSTLQDFLITRGLGGLMYIGILATLLGVLAIVAAFQ